MVVGNCRPGGACQGSFRTSRRRADSDGRANGGSCFISVESTDAGPDPNHLILLAERVPVHAADIGRELEGSSTAGWLSLCSFCLPRAHHAARPIPSRHCNRKGERAHCTLAVLFAASS